MGVILIASCNTCGYRVRDLFFGGGMMNHETYFGYPVINNDTDEINMANIYTKESIIKDEDNLVFYDSNSLINKKEIKDDDVLKWGEYYVYSGEIYYCPKCKKYSLGFNHSGNWD